MVQGHCLHKATVCVHVNSVSHQCVHAFMFALAMLPHNHDLVRVYEGGLCALVSGAFIASLLSCFISYMIPSVDQL